MPSLEQAYDRKWSGLRRPRRLIAGLVLAGAGVVALVAALLLVATGGSDSTAAKASAGVAAGLGVPVMLLGVVVVLPASRRQRLGVVFGALLATAGVWLFWEVYPERWTRTADPLAFETLLVYGVGCTIALWFVFSTIATFRLRNNPPGTVELEVVREGSTRTIQVSQDRYREMVSDGGDADDVIREIERDR
jgi:cytochrome bd-type quinol oxidase subunit 2